MNERTNIRGALVDLVAGVAAFGAARVYAGRPKSIAAKNCPRAYVYFSTEEVQRLSKGTAAKSRHAATFVVEVYAIGPAVAPGDSPTAAALEDELDDLVEAIRAAVDSADTLTGLAWSADVVEVEIDIDPTTQDDMGRAGIVLQVIYDTTRGA